MGSLGEIQRLSQAGQAKIDGLEDQDPSPTIARAQLPNQLQDSQIRELVQLHLKEGYKHVLSVAGHTEGFV